MMFGSGNLKKTSRNRTTLASLADEVLYNIIDLLYHYLRRIVFKDNEDEADGNHHATSSHHSSSNIIPVAGPSGLNNNKNTLNGNLEAYFQLYIKNVSVSVNTHSNVI